MLVRRLIRVFKSDVFFQRYAVYFSASMVVAVFNYAFHPVLGRLLSPADFGEIQALLALVMQSAIVFGTFSVIAINLTANAEDTAQRNAILFQLQKICLGIVGVALVVLLFFLQDITNFFNFASIYVLVALAVMWPISALVTFRNAFLQGSGDFFHSSTGQVIASASRLMLAVGLIMLGLGVLGGVISIVLASVLLLIYFIYHSRKQFPLVVQSSMHILEKGSVLKELRYGVLVFFATALVTVYYTADVLIVKRFFSPEEAGLYSGVSAIAKILFFIIAPVSVVLLSSIKRRNSFSQNSSALIKALVIACVIGSVGVCTFYVFYDIIILVMLGSAYLPFAHLLPAVSLVMFLAALANICILYFLALRRFFLILVSFSGLAFAVWTLFFGYTSINALLTQFSVSLIAIISFLMIIYVKDYFSYRAGSQ